MRQLAGLLLGALLSTPLSASDDEQTRIAREMIQVLDAYAVYKMGDFDEAFERYRRLAEAGNRRACSTWATCTPQVSVPGPIWGRR